LLPASRLSKTTHFIGHQHKKGFNTVPTPNLHITGRQKERQRDRQTDHFVTENNSSVNIP